MSQLNNFDFIRLAAATAVMASHQFALFGLPEPKWSGGHTYGGLGVLAFFSLSGYLVAGSWRRDPRLLPFAARRLLRIWPALAVAVVASALLLGPLVTTLTPDQYFRSAETWGYLRNLNLVQSAWSLPGVFGGSMASSSVNGSLWTIPLEIRCYFLLAAAGVAGLLRWHSSCVALYVASMFYFLCITRVLDMDVDRTYVQLGLVFFGGALLQRFQQHWFRKRYWVVAGAVLVSAPFWNSWGHEAAITLVVPLVVVVCGIASAPVVRQFGRFGDFSYGMYVYAFPVQQTVLWAAEGRLSVGSAFCASFALCLMLACLSWHLVEKRALRYKPHTARKPPAEHIIPASASVGATRGAAACNVEKV